MQFIKSQKGLMTMLLFTTMLVTGRIMHTGTPAFVFLIWNLFLAIVPLYFSQKLLATHSRATAGVCLLLWLLFFPNAMYIITDLFHLRPRQGIPLWYDLLVLFTAALNGLLAGFASLRNVEDFLCRHVSPRYIPAVQLLLFFISSYGIYLGRYLRWNSWDIITNPFPLLYDVRQDVFHPFRNMQCWLLSLFFSIWLFIMYRYFRKAESKVL